MEIHSRPQHMRVDDKNFLTIWTSDFNGLTHDLPLSILDFGFSIGVDSGIGTEFRIPGSALLQPTRRVAGEERGAGCCFVTFVLFVVNLRSPYAQ